MDSWRKMKHSFSFCIFFVVLSHHGTKSFEQATAEGDIIIGGLFPIHESVNVTVNYDGSENQICDRFSTANLVQSLIMVQALEEINQKQELGNLTLGYLILDSCGDVTTSLRKIPSFMRGNCNTSAQQSSPVLAVIGGYYSEIAIAVTRLLNLEYIPEISYGATSGLLSDKTRFPSFMRTVPQDNHQARAISEILDNNGWTWVGVLTTDGEYARYITERLWYYTNQKGICFAFTSVLPDNLNDYLLGKSIESTVKTIIDNENVSVIVSFAKPDHMMYIFQKLLNDPQGTRRIWLASDIWSQSPEILNTKKHTLSDIGTIIGITFKSGNTTKLKRYLDDLDENPSHHNNNPFLKQHGSTSSEKLKTMIYPSAVFSIELAVKAIAQAVEDLCTERDCKTKRPSPLELRGALWKAKFHMDGKNYSFDPHGDLNTEYDIVLWKQTSESLDVNDIVARYSILQNSLTFISQETKHAFYIYIGNVTSRCTDSCQPGYSKTSVSGQPRCCYQCEPCAENTFSNTTDSEKCNPCEKNYYSLKGSSKCLPRKTDFLKWGDVYLIVLLSFTSLGAVLTIVVGIIFLAHWNTPVVRSSVGPISIILLLSLMITFTSVILFGGPPNSYQCQARQVVFGLSFTLCVSCIMVKSFKIVLAFEFDPVIQSVLKKLYKPYLIIAVCMAGQVVIVTTWLIHSPPTADSEITQNNMKLMFCNEKLIPAFGAMLVYIGLLALICFGVAFKGRKLPDCYNDAKFITFAMLIYFISWIMFGPVYANVTGKYIPAVEMVVILISAYGILFCQFFTKCYIILCKKEANTEKSFRRDIRNYSRDHKGSEDELSSKGIQNPTLSLSLESFPNSQFSDSITDWSSTRQPSDSSNSLSPVSNPQQNILQNNLNSFNTLKRISSLPTSLIK
ncbi:G-protein coupled receptor family C group 6 member A-like [Astatotilapia calliptera]|uniref:G-protein coupled receptor family C group 6 member A n=1 Tax=Astatotilapia calliptera TaxID=8154 RepID=A0A3P8P4E1_ASTCA|nr:G-protein coupled receptor family C group 6 member A-like [Astatotilapia calliptera]